MKKTTKNKKKPVPKKSFAVTIFAALTLCAVLAYSRQANKKPTTTATKKEHIYKTAQLTKDKKYVLVTTYKIKQ